MRVAYEYSHFGGAEIMQVRFPAWNSEINRAIGSVEAAVSNTNGSKSMKGDALYSPAGMSAQFQRAFTASGYRRLRESYTVRIPGSTTEIPGAYEQIDFVKARLMVQVQFGEYAFMYHDLAKFQYFFSENKFDVAVEILPCYGLKHKMTNSASYGERLVYDMERQKLNLPVVPVKVILIDTAD